MKKTTKNLKLLFLLLILLFFSFCSDETVNEPPPPYEYSIPEQTNDGWQTETLAEANIEKERLIQLVDYINYGIIKKIHSVIIVKHNKLVFEEYFRGHSFEYSASNHEGIVKDYGINTIHNQASVTKSFTSALVGIAIDKGFIKNEDEKIFSFFPEYEKYNAGMKIEITLKHLLTMSAGFQWNEHELSYGNQQNDLIQMWNVVDPLEYLISKPLDSTPGTKFYYNSGCTNLLGETIFKASGIKPDTFADQYLFNKLGFLSRTWQKFSNGVVFVSGDLRIRPRDMAKLGSLYLNKGYWNGEQIISQEWVEKSTSALANPPNDFMYGYQWWINNYIIGGVEYHSFSARGWGGQTISVIPDLEMVIVLTGGNYVNYDPSDEIIRDYILPSVK